MAGEVVAGVVVLVCAEIPAKRQMAMSLAAKGATRTGARCHDHGRSGVLMQQAALQEDGCKPELLLQVCSLGHA